MVGTVWSFDGRRTVKKGEIRKFNVKEIKDICKDTTNPTSREYMRKAETHVNLMRHLYNELQRPTTYTNGKTSWTVVTDLFLMDLRNTVWTVIRDHERQKKVMKVFLRDKEKMLVPSKRKPRGPNKNLGYTPKRTNSRPGPPPKALVQNVGPSAEPPAKPKRGRKKRLPPTLEAVENPHNQENYIANDDGKAKIMLPTLVVKEGMELSEEMHGIIFDHGFYSKLTAKDFVTKNFVSADDITGLPIPTTRESLEPPAPTEENNPENDGPPILEETSEAPNNPDPPQESNSSDNQQPSTVREDHPMPSTEAQEEHAPNRHVEKTNADAEQPSKAQEQASEGQSEIQKQSELKSSGPQEEFQERQKQYETRTSEGSPTSEQNSENQPPTLPADPVKKVPHYNEVPLELFYKSSRQMDSGRITALVPHEDFGDDPLKDFFWVEYTPEKTVLSKTRLDEIPASYFRYIGYNKSRTTKSEEFISDSEVKYKAIKQFAPDIPLYMWAYYVQDANLIVIEDIVPLSVQSNTTELFKFRLFVEDVIREKKPEQTIIVVTRRWRIFSLSDLIYYFSPKGMVYQGSYKDYSLNNFTKFKEFMDTTRNALEQKFTREKELSVDNEDLHMVGSMLEEFYTGIRGDGLRFIELKDDRPQILQKFASKSYSMYENYLSNRTSSSSSSEGNFPPVVWVGIDSCPKCILDAFNAGRLNHIKQEFALALLYTFQVNEVIVQKDGLLIIENLFIPNLWDDIVMEFFVGHCRDMLQMKMANRRGERLHGSRFAQLLGIDEEEEEEIVEDVQGPSNKP